MKEPGECGGCQVLSIPAWGMHSLGDSGTRSQTVRSDTFEYERSHAQIHWWMPLWKDPVRSCREPARYHSLSLRGLPTEQRIGFCDLGFVPERGLRVHNR